MSSHTFIQLNYTKALDVIPIFWIMKLKPRKVVVVRDPKTPRSQDTETHNTEAHVQDEAKWKLRHKSF